MTNRSRDPRLKALTLTFDPADRGRSVTGPRPSTRVARTPGYAPQKHTAKFSPAHKFSSSGNRHQSASFYQRKLHKEIDRLLLDDEPRPTPNVTRPASAKVSSDNVEAEYIRLAQSLLSPHHPLLTARASASIAPQSFLIDDLLNRPCSDLNEKLGRPTRTTLLRNRQRCNSAPINSYASREEIKRRNQQILDQRSRPNTARNSHEPVYNDMGDGESLHAFLIGARYNRAHYVDAKSLMKYGVYMPRNNPKACFVNDNKAAKPSVNMTADSPPIPPESPVMNAESDVLDTGRPVDDDTSTPAPPSTPAPQTPASQTPTPSAVNGDHSDTPSQSRSSVKPRQAWSEVHTEPVIGDVRHPTRSANGPKLNITGKKYGYGGTRPLSATTPSILRDNLFVPPPPPSVDLSNSIMYRLDLPINSPSRNRTQALSEHSRSVRFSEPDEFGIFGKAVSPPRSPKCEPATSEKGRNAASECIMCASSGHKNETKENDSKKIENENVQKFFMTEEPEKIAEMSEENVKVESDGLQATNDNADGAVVENDVAMDKVPNDGVVTEDDVPNENNEQTEVDDGVGVVDHAVISKNDDAGVEDDEKVDGEVELDEAVADNATDPGHSDDEVRVDTPMPVTSVDISVRLTDSPSH